MTFKRYGGVRKLSEEHTDRVSLDQGGFTLVDCPARGAKETLDKRMIVDIMAFAFNNVSQRTPSCVVLITSDGDYSYSIAKIRDLGIKTIVIHGPQTTTAGVLLDVCDYALSFWHDVLSHIRKSAHNRSDNDEPLREEDGDEINSDVMEAIEDAIDGRHLTLCHSIYELVGGDGEWVEDAKVAASFYMKRGVENKDNERYNETRDSAIAGGFVQIGRRDTRSRTVQACVDSKWDSGSMQGRLSTYLLVRLTEQGSKQLDDPMEASRQAVSAHNSASYLGAGSSHSSKAVVMTVFELEAAMQSKEASVPTSYDRCSPAIDEIKGSPVDGAPVCSRTATSPLGAALDTPLVESRGIAQANVSRNQDAPSNQKTVLCTFYHQGYCDRGRSCTFAHGEGELRQRHRKVVITCRDWRMGFPGSCKWGNKCSFKHDGEG